MAKPGVSDPNPTASDDQVTTPAVRGALHPVDRVPVEPETKDLAPTGLAGTGS